MTLSNSLSGVGKFGLIPEHVARNLRAIDRAQGRIDHLRETTPALTRTLAARSLIESVIASNEIEGIRTTRSRAEKIAGNTLEPASRDEAELAGYRRALDDVYDRTPEPVTVPRLLHWHRELFRHEGFSVAGRFKWVENRVVNDDNTDRFRTVSSADTPMAIRSLVECADATIERNLTHPALIAAGFALDFLVIHPFEDGNGRVARIATNAFLESTGYGIGRLVSLEQLIADRRDAYYGSLSSSTIGWHENDHDVWPWAEFFTQTLSDAYERAHHRLLHAQPKDMQTLVLEWLTRRAPTHFSFGDATRDLAGVPQGTLRKALTSLRDTGALELQKKGRGSTWIIRDRAAIQAKSQET